MFCNKCGAPLKDGAKFCENCGSAAESPRAAENVRINADKIFGEEELISGRVTKFTDGKYRWVYKVNLFKNPTIFFLIWKIFFFIIVGIFAVVMIADAANQSDFWTDRFLNDLKFFGFFMLGMTALVGVSYLIYAAIMGGKYIVEFEMDEYGVMHRQTGAQAEKARKIGRAAVVAGMASGRLSTVGAGIGAQRTEMYSDFSKTRSVKAYKKRGLIKVNGRLDRNQVYAAPEDFEFVKDFIVSHCLNLKK